MRLILLSRRPDVYSMRRLAEEASGLGFAVEITDPETYQPKSPDELIWPRLGLWRFHEALAHLVPFENEGRNFVNKPSALARARDKAGMARALLEAGLPHPHTEPRPDWSRFATWVAKPRFGGQGFGLELVSSDPEVAQLDPSWEWIFQELIPPQEVGDARLLVSERGLIAAMSRRRAPGEWRTNLTRGAEPVAFVPTTELIEQAQRARQLTGLRIAGVDLLPSVNGWVVLEVNGSPGFEGLEAASGVNVARKLLEELRP